MPVLLRHQCFLCIPDRSLFFLLHAPCLRRAAVACRDAVSCHAAAGICEWQSGSGVMFFPLYRTRIYKGQFKIVT